MLFNHIAKANIKSGLSNLIGYLNRTRFSNGIKAKVAVSITGHFRNTFKYPLILEYLKNSYFEFDIFIHTWDRLESDTPSWRPKEDADKTQEAFHVDRAKELLHPEKICVEKQSSVVLPGITNRKLSWGNTAVSYVGYKYTWYAIYANLKIILEHSKTNNTNYDYILRIRPDMYRMWDYLPKYMFNKMIVEMLRRNEKFLVGVNLGGLGGDNIFAGDVENYKKLVFGLYENFDEVYLNTADKSHPEYMVDTVIKSMRLPHKSVSKVILGLK